MITNMNYLQTSVELLAQGDLTVANQIKILDTIKFICEQNIERLEMAQLENINESDRS
jgi:hypothetical protein